MTDAVGEKDRRQPGRPLLELGPGTDDVLVVQGRRVADDIGAVLVHKGDIGYVRSIGSFLQQFYIYAVEFTASGHQVGMRAKELCTLDHLPAEVIAQLGERAAQLPTLR